MPRKAKYVSMDARKRFRICVELDAECVALLEGLVIAFKNDGDTVSLSQLVRHALKECDKKAGWLNYKPESLQAVRRRLELRAHTKPTP